MRDPLKPIQRRYHINSAGIVYFLVVCLLGVGAINSQNNLLFLLFGAALGAMVVSGIISGAMMVKLTATRQRPRWAQVGKSLRLEYSIGTRSRIMPAFALDVQEVHRIANSDERFGISRDEMHAFVTCVPRRSVVHTQAVYIPNRRGVLRLERVRLVSSFPFGLMCKSVAFSHEAEVLVWPEVIEPPGGVRRVLGRQGRSHEESRNRRGNGQEFFGLRSYVPGDPARTVAWKASARSETLLTRQHTDPVSTRLMVRLMLEAENETCSRALIERTISIAAGFVSQAQREGIVFALTIPQAGVSTPFGRSGRHVANLLDALAAIDLSAIERAPQKDAPQAPAQSALLQIQPRTATASAPSEAIVIVGEEKGAVANDAREPARAHEVPREASMS